MRLTALLLLPAVATIALAAVERAPAAQTADGPSSQLRLDLQPSHADQADRYVTAARAALASYGRLLGPFPAATLTLVDPIVSPDLKARRSGTTEGSHATIVAASHWFAPWTTAEPEMAVVQGIGRVYWRAHASLDDEERRLREALAAFTAARVFADAFPGRFVRTHRYFRGLVTWPYSDAPWTKDVDGYLADVALDPAADPIDLGRAHDVLALATLERIVGAETMDRILRAYASRGASGPAASADFEAIAGEVGGRDLTWFFDATRRPNVAFDYAVDDAATRARAVVVRRLAAGMFPVDVRVTFDDGSSRVERWDGRDERRTFEYAAAPAIATVEIDPDHVLRLDVHRTNNSWSAHPRGRSAARSWSLRWLVWFQHTLMDYAFVA
jgi:hypothetical protein